MNILFSFSGVACVSFPVGKPPYGTCEFASKRCLAECAAFKNATPETIVGYEPKQSAFEFIYKKPLFIVCAKIIEELKEMDTEILYWFGSGDCMRAVGPRISDIMKYLSHEHIIQCGFTRNKELWKRASNIENVHLCLTIENREEAEKIRGEGLVGVPDFDSECGVELLYKTWHGGACGTSYYTTHDGIQYEANCKLCYKGQRGCFSVRPWN